MSSPEVMISPMVLAKALNDVAQVNIEPTRVDALTLAAPHVSALLADAASASRLLNRIEFYESLRQDDADETADELDLPFAPLRPKDALPINDDDLINDVPTQGRVSRLNEMLQRGLTVAGSEAAAQPVFRLTVPFSWPYCAPLITFRDLGLDETSDVWVRWSDTSRKTFTLFISSVLEELPEKRGKIAELIRHAARHQEAALQTYVCNVARTAGVIDLEEGEEVSRLCYASTENAIFIDVVFNKERTLHSRLSLEDPNAFSQKILSAFRGHSEYVRTILRSMLNATEPVSAKK